MCKDAQYSELLFQALLSVPVSDSSTTFGLVCISDLSLRNGFDFSLRDF